MWKRRKKEAEWKKSPTQVSWYLLFRWNSGVDNSTLCTLCTLLLLIFFLTFTFSFHREFEKENFLSSKIFFLLPSANTLIAKKHAFKERKERKSTYIFQGFSRPSRKCRMELRKESFKWKVRCISKCFMMIKSGQPNQCIKNINFFEKRQRISTPTRFTSSSFTRELNVIFWFSRRLLLLEHFWTESKSSSSSKKSLKMSLHESSFQNFRFFGENVILPWMQIMEKPSKENNAKAFCRRKYKKKFQSDFEFIQF